MNQFKVAKVLESQENGFSDYDDDVESDENDCKFTYKLFYLRLKLYELIFNDIEI